MKRSKCNLTGKTIYATLSEAKASMFGFGFRHVDPITNQRINRRVKKKEQKRVYYCDGCQGYHLTSQDFYTEEKRYNFKKYKFNL